MEEKGIIKTFAIQSNSNPARMRSTSGGTFYEIARYILQINGYVCAAGFDEDLQVIHKIIDRMEDLEELEGAKYVQSNLQNCFPRIKVLLDSNKIVLFAGTPCQVGGIKTYLRKNYENLYLVDLVCFGVPSPLIYSSWLKSISERHNKKINKIYFRDKSFGYAAPNVKIIFDDQTSTEQNFLVKSYMKTFMSELNVRPCCSECFFKGPHRDSDLTLGDCWHIAHFSKDLDDNLGTTSVFVHTTKGLKLIQIISTNSKIVEIETQRAIALDGKKMIQSVNLSPVRREFFSDLTHMRYEELVQKWVPNSLKNTLGTFAKRTIGKLPLFKFMLKKIRG